MIRVDLGKDDFQRRRSGLAKLLGGLSVGGKKGGGRLGGGGAEVKGALALIVGIALAVLPYLFFTQYQAFVAEQQAARIKELQEKLAVLDQEMEKLTPYKRELESYDAQKKLVKDRLEAIRALLANRSTPVAVMDAVGQALPKRAWLTTMELKVMAGKGELQVAGSAYSNEDISDYVDALTKSVYVAEVTLKGVTKTQTDRLDVKTFTLNIVPKGTFGGPPAAGAALPGVAPEVSTGAGGLGGANLDKQLGIQ